MPRIVAAHGFDSVVHAAAGNLHDFLDRVIGHGIDRVGGAKYLSEFTFFGEGIDSDDFARAGDLGCIDRRETAADHGHGFARDDLAGVKNRSRSGSYGAADDGRPVQRHVLVDGDAGIFVDQHLFAEGGQIEHLPYRSLVNRTYDPGCLVGRTARIGPKTQGHTAGDTEFAVSAEDGQARNHVIARLHRLHFRSDRTHHARRFMTRNGRQRMRIGTVDEVEVGMAQAACLGVDQDFMRSGIGEFHLADREPADLFKNSCLCHQRVAPMSPELWLSLPDVGAAPSRRALAVGPASGRCLANSIRAIERACTSSGPSARRSVR